MDKNKELAKNTAIITLGKICTQFVSFFLFPLYTAMLSTEEYGIVDLIVTYTSLLMPIVLLQMDQALFRFLIDQRKNASQKKEVISTAVLFACVQIVITLLIFSIIEEFISFQYKWFLLINVLASVCANMMLQTARGMGDNVSYAVGGFLSASIQIIGNVLFLVVFKMGVIGMLIATILAHALTSVFLFLKERVYCYISLKAVSKLKLKEILRYSIPLIPNALCWWVLNASDRTIVWIFLGASFNGLLSVAHKFSTIYISIYNIFNLSWTESAALHMNEDDRDIFFSGVIVTMFKLFMCAGIGIIACMPFVFPILINSKFQEAYGVIPVFMLASMLNVVVGLYSVIYVALKKTKEIAKTSIYSGVINIVTHLLFVNFIGLYAAAVSTAVAFGIMALYRYFDLKKYINIVLPTRWIILTVIAYVVTCFGYYSGNKWTQVIILMMTVLFSVLMNRDTLKKVFSIFLKKREYM